MVEPAGLWAGKEVEAVYDPRRHDVMLLRGDPGDDARGGFRDVGYHRAVSDGTNEMWVRDRLVVIAMQMNTAERNLCRDHVHKGFGHAL